MIKSFSVICAFINGDTEEFKFQPIEIDEEAYESEIPIEEAFYNEAFIVFTNEKRKYVSKDGICYKTDKIIKFEIKLEDIKEV